ncbi:MAG: transposase, partial [Syntrophales bacterium]
LPAALFPQTPTIRFVPEQEVCSCGGRLGVKKTRRKTVLSLTGPFLAHETVYVCSSCSKSFRSEALLQLVQSRCNVAYDILVFVGQSLFQRHRTIDEVRLELSSAHNVQLSASEIGYLGRKFILFLAIAHSQATPRIRQAMNLAGGYVLHLDATHDGDAPVLMTSMDSISKFVLANVKISSEDSADIANFLQKIKVSYGIPTACVHDMGKGICKAVADVFPGTPDFVCHFHFLRDIGKDLLEPAYGELRKRLRKHSASTRLSALVREVRAEFEHEQQRAQCALMAKALKSGEQHDIEPTTAIYLLALWALQGKREGDGYGFPFDRPLLIFAKRILELNRLLPAVMHQFGGSNKFFCKFAKLIGLIANDLELQQKVEELNWRLIIFDQLRDAMRIAPVDGSNGLNDDVSAEFMTSIRQGVKKFRQGLDDDRRLVTDPLCRKMAVQIDKYGDKLFADPIVVKTPNGTIIIYPQRTNNILEQFFRSFRRGERRKTGNDSLCRTLQTMLADMPLVKNLDNPQYREILLNGKADLEELFAEIGLSPLSESDPEEPEPNLVLPGFRKLLTMKNLPNLMLGVSLSRHGEAKSN